MNIGIIGAEESKFTAQTKQKALDAINEIILGSESPTIVSGHCHLGGVDIWAEEAADALQIPKLIYPPEVHQWDGGSKIGYKQRNIQIATASDIVYVIGVETLPPGYLAKPWQRGGCYHCQKVHHVGNVHGYTNRHVKSGACWTAWYAAEQLGKEARWIII